MQVIATIYLLVLAFISGSVFGSFICCAADRYKDEQSVFDGRSHCPNCGHKLGLLDLFPILSYLFLRGKCRYCGSHIPLRCLITEAIGGIVFLTVALKFGLSVRTLEICLLSAVLMAVTLIDYDTMEIPDGLIGLGVLIFLVFSLFDGDFYGRLHSGAIGALCLGGGMLVLSLIMDFLLKKDTLGGGDIKLFGVLGLFLGPGKGLLTIILSSIVGLISALGGNRKSEFPFGPAIAFSAFVALLFGQEIVDLYLTIIF